MSSALAGKFFTSSATWVAHLFIFAYISIMLGDGSQNKAVVISVKKCSAQVFIQKFSIFNLTHRSQIHFEYVFVIVLDNVLISFFYMQLSSVPSTSYCRDCLFSTVYCTLASFDVD